MLNGILYLFMFAFAAAQGAVVFATAVGALRLMKTSSWGAKVLSMAVSYLLWIGLTGCAYDRLGGGWGIMDGGLMILALCLSAGAASAIYLAIWIFSGLRRKASA